MKHLILTFLFLLCVSLFAYPHHSPELRRPLHLLYHFDESRQILSKVEAEAPLNVSLTQLGERGSNAIWDPNRWTILLNSSKKRTIGVNVRSILFELHNALSNKKFVYYNGLARAGKISKAAYVETIERIEYQNALQTIAILKKGIELNIFPKDADWNVAPNFEEHFQIQKKAGHSQFITYNYDNLRNTIFNAPRFQEKT